MSTTVTAPEKQPLDEVMLAMDVVDTLRHHEKLVAKELDSDSRDEQLKEKLRKIYHTQGIEVPDSVLEEGVQALREDRFSYRPSAPGLASRLARIYVSRERWGKWFVALLAALLVAWGAYQFLVAGPRSAMPDRVRSSYQAAWHSAGSERAKSMVKQVNSRAETAVENGDRAEMKQALAVFEQLKKQLDQEYSLRVVARPGERTGVWRIPDANSAARNYYIIVEAVTADGKTLKVPVTSEETGKQQLVSKWGVRVGRDVFERIAADKQDDGIIQNNILGHKKKGDLEPEYTIPAVGGAITSW